MYACNEKERQICRFRGKRGGKGGRGCLWGKSLIYEVGVCMYQRFSEARKEGICIYMWGVLLSRN